jgi:DNA primase
MWDGEKEAIKDAVNAGLIVKGAGFDVRVAVLPSGKDPNEVSTAEARKTYYEAVPLTSASAVNLLMMASKM